MSGCKKDHKILTSLGLLSIYSLRNHSPNDKQNAFSIKILFNSPTHLALGR